jgi:carboxyl-terminal processing protease
MILVPFTDCALLKWLDRLIEKRRDTSGFSTDHHAFQDACHWGLAQGRGERLELEFKDLQRKKRKRTITYGKATYRPWGPVKAPFELQGDGEVRYGKTENGYGYIHLRKCPKNLPERVDEALAALGDPDGLILDLRANGGGGFDHEGLLGRFIPAGKALSFNKRYESAGPSPYGGPMVVIIDGLTLSAGETCTAIFKEDGRAYVIGESPTSGMSSSKTTIELPSGLFALYVSIRSNMGRSNGGRGIEGIGIPPHEVVPYDPEDLAEGRDTLLLRAEALLEKYPRGKVPYDPGDFGWRR